MGFYVRKSVSIGPFRFNLSGSGIGISFGVRGFRLGSGPRGKYVHLGRAGVYYRHALREAGIVDSASEDLLEAIRAKRRKLTLRSWAIVGAIALLLIALARTAP